MQSARCVQFAGMPFRDHHDGNFFSLKKDKITQQKQGRSGKRTFRGDFGQDAPRAARLEPTRSGLDSSRRVGEKSGEESALKMQSRIGFILPPKNPSVERILNGKKISLSLIFGASLFWICVCANAPKNHFVLVQQNTSAGVRIETRGRAPYIVHDRTQGDGTRDDLGAQISCSPKLTTGMEGRS